jgi:hypothetical protein
VLKTLDWGSVDCEPKSFEQIERSVVQSFTSAASESRFELELEQQYWKFTCLLSFFSHPTHPGFFLLGEGGALEIE